MGLRNVPTSIKDPNLAGFLRELRAAVGGVSDQVTRLVQTRSSSGGGGGGGGGGDGGGGTDPGGGGGGGDPATPPAQTTVVLTIEPSAPKSSQVFTLTATVTGDQPTGRVQFRQGGNLMTLDPVDLSAGKASVSTSLPKGTYTFVAEYSGDLRNLSAVSNTLTLEIGSVWDGPPDSVTSLSAVGGIGYIVVSWVMPFIGDLDVVEVWASESNDRATSTKVGESGGSMFIFTPDAARPSWYFWVRVRDSEGLFSAYFPDTTEGVPGYAFSLEAEIAGSELWGALGTRLDGLDAEVAAQVALLQGQIDEVLGAADYDAGVTYQTDDIVKYNGALYRAKQVTTGNLPTNTTYWQLIGNYTSIGDAVAAHTNSISTLTTGLSAEVSARETLAARVTTAEGNITTQAGYINNRYTKAEVDSAMASQLTGIVASYQAADATNLNAAKTYSDAAVTTEATARASADSSLATQINTVSATAGAKNRTYRQTTAPASGMTVGDIWFDSDGGNKAYRYNGTTWELTDDTRIAANTAAIQTETTARADADSAMASQITTLQSSVAGNTATIQTQATVTDGIKAQYMVKTDVNGLVSGFGLYNDGEVSDFFIRADRFAVGNPAALRTGTCSIAGHTTAAACKAAGGTWTWTNANATNIPFIVYTTQQTITSPDGQQTLTVEPGVYMKSASIQKAFIDDAQFTGYLKSYSWPMTNGVPDAIPGSFPFSGWILDKSVSNPTLKIYGGGFGMWDQYGKPIITSGKIAFDQFRRLILTASAEAFVVGPAPDNAVTPASITLRVRAQNLAGTISLTATSGYTGTFASITVSENGDADFTIYPANFTGAVATFTTASTIAGVVYNDSLTIAKVQEGSNALTMLMSNESDSLATTSVGGITGTVTVSTNVKVLRGSKNVLYGATAESSPGWSVAVTMEPAGAAYTWDQATGTLSIPMTTSSADVVRALVLASRGSETATKVMTVVKAKQGVAGISPILLDLDNENQTVAAQKDGTWISGTPATTTARLYLGATQLTSGITWSVQSATAGITYTPTNNTSSYTVSVTNMTAALATGTITIAAVYNGVTYTQVFTISKANAGADGTPAEVYEVVGPSTLARDKDGTIKESSFAVNLWRRVGQADRTAYAGSLRVNFWVGDTLRRQDTFDNITVHTISRADIAATDTRIVLNMFKDSTLTQRVDFETIPIVVDGPKGDKGDQGSKGDTGTRGGVYAKLSGAFTPLDAWNAILAAANATTCVPGDYVGTSDGSFYQYDSGTGSGSTWLPSGFQVHGNAVVAGTLSASALKTGELWSNQITLQTGSNGTFGQAGYTPTNYIQSYGFTSGASTGFRIDGAGNAEFNNVKVRGDVLLGGGNQIQNSEALHGYTDITTWYESWNNTTNYPPQFLTGENATGGYFNLLQPSGGYSTTNGYMYALIMRSGTARASRISVQAGKRYQFSADAMINSGYTRGDLYIDWHSANTGNSWLGASGVVSTTAANTVQPLAIIATAPAGATHCVPVLRKYCPSTAQYTSFFFTKMVFAEVPTGQVSPIPWSPGGISLLEALAIRNNSLAKISTVSYFGQNCSLPHNTLDYISYPTRGGTAMTYSHKFKEGTAVSLLITIGFNGPLSPTDNTLGIKIVNVVANGGTFNLFSRDSGAGAGSRFFSASLVIDMVVPTGLTTTIRPQVKQNMGAAADISDLYIYVQEVYK